MLKVVRYYLRCQYKKKALCSLIPCVYEWYSQYDEWVGYIYFTRVYLCCTKSYILNKVHCFYFSKVWPILEKCLTISQNIFFAMMTRATGGGKNLPSEVGPLDGAVAGVPQVVRPIWHLLPITARNVERPITCTATTTAVHYCNRYSVSGTQHVSTLIC